MNQQADSEKHNSLTALHLAAERGDAQMVSILLRKGASVDLRTTTKTTPFYRAARGGSREVLAMLHDAGSEVDAKTWDNFTPLVEATARTDEQMVLMLLDWGADPLVKMIHGHTAIDVAWYFGSKPILGLFARHLKKAGRQSEYVSKIRGIESASGFVQDSETGASFN